MLFNMKTIRTILACSAMAAVGAFAAPTACSATLPEARAPLARSGAAREPVKMVVNLDGYMLSCLFIAGIVPQSPSAMHGAIGLSCV